MAWLSHDVKVLALCLCGLLSQCPSGQRPARVHHDRHCNWQCCRLALPSPLSHCAYPSPPPIPPTPSSPVVLFASGQLLDSGAGGATLDGGPHDSDCHVCPPGGRARFEAGNTVKAILAENSVSRCPICELRTGSGLIASTLHDPAQASTGEVDSTLDLNRTRKRWVKSNPAHAEDSQRAEKQKSISALGSERLIHRKAAKQWSSAGENGTPCCLVRRGRRLVFREGGGHGQGRGAEAGRRWREKPPT
ncbi:hypothetical protein Naga_101252g1 [Nannochloropsis gaditana]|uniref:Uncharacterized protein n=1 Tax=Nannochloropsis gaditana TaxID=72520 RepID=W7TJJ7_9STRA|nr:hypothetical protein Naga_101252g1 [Nannochloropsis gaditana]